MGLSPVPSSGGKKSSGRGKRKDEEGSSEDSGSQAAEAAEDEEEDGDLSETDRMEGDDSEEGNDSEDEEDEDEGCAAGHEARMYEEYREEEQKKDTASRAYGKSIPTPPCLISLMQKTPRPRPGDSRTSKCFQTHLFSLFTTRGKGAK
jgi:hypothetical protein